MRTMIEADIFIMGRGYFSYVAAIISEGIKLFDPWGHIPPLEGWIVRDANGGYSDAVFDREFEKLIARRASGLRTP